MRIPEYLEDSITDVLGSKCKKKVNSLKSDHIFKLFFQDKQIPNLKVQSEKLYAYLHDRRIQLEKSEVNALRQNIKNELEPKFSGFSFCLIIFEIKLKEE